MRVKQATAAPSEHDGARIDHQVETVAWWQSRGVPVVREGTLSPLQGGSLLPQGVE